MFEEYTRYFKFLEDVNALSHVAEVPSAESFVPTTERFVFGHNGYGLVVTQNPDKACCDPFTVEIKAVAPSEAGFLDVDNEVGKAVFGTRTGVMTCATKSDLQRAMTQLACMPEHSHWSPKIMKRGVHDSYKVIMPVYDRAKCRAQPSPAC